MKEQFKNQIIIDGLQYCNWNREIFEDLWRGGLTAVHATLVYWENTEESFKKIDKWNDLFIQHKDIICHAQKTQNIIEAAVDQKVPRVLLVSTDKAAEPTNLYGASKLCAEKLFVSGNTYAPKKTRFSAVRYGNVIGSRGSVVESLINNPNAKKVSLTHEDMTRFWITLEESFDLVLFALKNMEGGEIFVPKIPSMKLVDLFDAIVPNAKKEITGIRPGEKLHEALLSSNEARCARELKKYFVVLPESHNWSKYNPYKKYNKQGKKIDPNFIFASNTNNKWLSTNDFKKILVKLKKQI